jgi:broad specificity phosphatase PhoE
MRPCDDVFQRAAAVIVRLRALPAGQTALVVAHSGIIRAAMALLFGLPQARLHALAQDNATLAQDTGG